jgi:hypothetical protein
MANLMDFLQFSMSDDVVENLTSQIGAKDPKQTMVAANGIFSVLTNALSKNTANESALSGLAGALDRDHDGSILDDVMGLLGGRSQPKTPKMMDGLGIIGHLLGGKQNGVVDAISQMSGLDQNGTASLMLKLAPMVMGVLGRVKKQKNMDTNILSNYLQTSAQQVKKEIPNTDLLTRILDQDGDGSMMDDVAQIGLKALGNFFKR